MEGITKYILRLEETVFLLTIGNDVTIFGNVKFLMNDNAVINVTNGEYTDLLGVIHVRDHCFVGFGFIILSG